MFFRFDIIKTAVGINPCLVRPDTRNVIGGDDYDKGIIRISSVGI